MMRDDEIVISAFGCITPLGNSYDQIKYALQAGISGIKENKKFNCKDYVIKHAGIPDEGNEKIQWSSTSKNIVGEMFYADYAAKNLVNHPNYPSNFYEPQRIGCIVGVDEPAADLRLCFNMFSETNASNLMYDKLVNNIRLGEYINHEPTTVLNTIYKHIPFTGYANCHMGLCSASLQAIGMGVRAIQRGTIDAAVVGGVSGKVNPINLARLELVGAISLDVNFAPHERSRPFDKLRSGFVLAEGGVLFLLEKRSNVEKRKVDPLLKILGYGTSLSAQHIVIPHTESLEMELCMYRAIRDAKIDVKQIDVVNAHGTSTILNDLHESKAINTVFGKLNNSVKVVANKSQHGHLIAAAGAMEVLNTLISINENFIPGTINVDNQDKSCNVNIVKKTEYDVHTSVVLKNSFGMGGLAASMILGKV